jgi:hypothetical protein
LSGPPADEEFHVFSVDVEEVGFTAFGGGDPAIHSWRTGGDLRRLTPGPDRT